MSSNRSRPGAALVAGASLAAVALLVPTRVAAEEPAEPQRLSIRPADSDRQWIELTLRPGEASRVRVELGNLGEAAVEADAYVSDVYTIVNGGFGARLRGEAPRGASTWLDVRPEHLRLDPGERVTRGLEIRVPSAAAAGEHITSLVIEATSDPGSEAPLKLRQVRRHAMAIVVHVPGPADPRLAVNGASYHRVGDAASVRVAIANPGNTRLQPVAEFSLTRASGAPVLDETLRMGSFYAWTETFLEIGLAAPLAPGGYCAEVHLRDPATGAEADGGGCLAVRVPGAGSPSGEVIGPTAGSASVAGAWLPVALLFAILIVAGLAPVVLLLVPLVRRRRRQQPITR
jgi:hypothetical protein